MTFVTSFLTDRYRAAKQDLIFLFITFGLAFFQFLGHIPLLDPDEGRYAEIPREMLERGDFITPYLNYVKYFEKPPLHYWLNAASLAIFGENEFAARFAGAFMGLLTVLVTYYAGRRLFDRRSGLLAALILGTSTGFLVQARINITDMTLTCCLCAALAFFAIALRDNEPRKGLHYYLFYVCAALAVLAKGLIGLVLPGGVIFFYLLFSGKWRLLREMRLATGIPLFLLIASPWFVAVSLRNPEFARFFFIHEHFERFLTKVHGRYQPLWFFIPVLAGTMLPWSFFIPSALKRVWKERRLPGGDSRLFLAIWAILIFVFFSKSNSKLIPYILPVFPPLALLMGSTFERLEDHLPRQLRTQGYALAAILTILGAGAVIYPHVAPRPAITSLGGAVIGVTFLCEGIASFRSISRGSLISLMTGLFLFSYLLGIVAPPFILNGVAEKKSVKKLGEIMREKARSDTVLASFGPQQGLPFFTHRRIVTVGGLGELEFGSQQGDQSAWFLDGERFKRLWDSPASVLVFLSEGDLAALREEVRTQPVIVARQEKKLVISNR